MTRIPNGSRLSDWKAERLRGEKKYVENEFDNRFNVYMFDV
jgi:hypothetical protein